MKTHLTMFALAGTLALAACSVTTESPPPRVGGYATTYASDVPADVTRYPSAPYEGGNAYYVNNHWYYQTNGGWVRFETEPEPLARHRHSWRPEERREDRREERREYRHDDRDHDRDREHERR